METARRTIEPIPTEEDSLNLKQKEKARLVNENRQKHETVLNKTYTLEKSEVDTLNITNIAKSEQNHAKTTLRVNQVRVNAPQDKFLTRNEPNSTTIQEQVQSKSNNIQNLQDQLQNLIDKAKTQIGPRENRPSTPSQIKTESLTQINNDSSKESIIFAKNANQHVKSHDYTISCDNSHKKLLGPNTASWRTRSPIITRQRNRNQLIRPSDTTRVSKQCTISKRIIQKIKNMDLEPPYGKMWYKQLSNREKEIHEEVKRRKRWKKIITEKRKRIQALETFIGNTSPTHEDEEVDQDVITEEKNWEKEYNKTVEDNYEEDVDKQRLVDQFTINDKNGQPYYEVNVVINITDVRKEKYDDPKDCVINYKICKQTATRIVQLIHQNIEEDDMQSGISEPTTMSNETFVDNSNNTQHLIIKKKDKTTATSSEDSADYTEQNSCKKRTKIIKSQAKSKIAKLKQRNEAGKFVKTKPTIIKQENITQRYSITKENPTKLSKIAVSPKRNDNLAGKLQPRENYPVVALQRIPYVDEPPTGASPEPRMDAGTARDSPDVTKVGAGPDVDRSMATPAECEAIDSQSEQTDRMVITAVTDTRGTTNIEPPTQAQEQAAEELKNYTP
ncbi:uncharacterized protein LOC120358429 [Solenopsis invicta]|uniref:uncharacterized protein LOC120358429 n=1 Tax=Solenopsis invicta TaxID=13686 RepID=UPI00193DE0E3|nr:uncharacterized protein LOC120358429 [Solenopsis invicta]